MAEWLFDRHGSPRLIFDDDCIHDASGRVAGWISSRGPLQKPYEPEDFGRAAGQSGEVVDQEHLKGRGADERRQEPTIGGPVLDADAREGLIDVGMRLEHLPALLRRVPPTGQELVVDRPLPVASGDSPRSAAPPKYSLLLTEALVHHDPDFNAAVLRKTRCRR
jgi:hypothetical protein